MKKTAQPIVISYLRFSRPEQLKGDSIRRQLSLGDDWAKRNGMQISDTYRDLGISAFRGKNATEGNLAKFLALVDKGRVPPGSILLIEQLDRLSRNALLDALELFLSIIRRGIKVVTLMDGQEYTRASLNANMQGLMYSIMQMSLAHEESAKKSERLAHAWVGKRMKMGEKPLTRRLPAWLKVQSGKIIIDPEKAAIVRCMLQLVMDGYGLTAITKKINAEADGLARVAHFNRSYTVKILSSRSLVGEFQPHRLKYVDGRKTREPIGEPIKNYYPALIDEDTYYAVRRRLSSRRVSGGPQTGFINLFQGILNNAADGTRMVVQDKGAGRRYVNVAAIDGRKGAGEYVAFPVSVFERTMLLQLHALILPRLAKPDTDEQEREAEALQARVAELDKRSEETQAIILAESLSSTAAVVRMLGKIEEERSKCTARISTIRGEIATKATVDLDIARHRLAGVLNYYKRGDMQLSNDERIELRNIIRHFVQRIDGTFRRNGTVYSAMMEIELTDGQSLKLGIFATRLNRMKRNALGHPIKSEHKKKEPEYRISLANPIWMPIASVDGRSYRIAEGQGTRHIDIETPEFAIR